MARLSLRWRVAVAFGLSSLLVPSLFAVVTWQPLRGMRRYNRALPFS